MRAPTRRVSRLVYSASLAVMVMLGAVLPAAFPSRGAAAPLPPDPKPAPTGLRTALPALPEDVSAADGTQISISTSDAQLRFCSSYGGANWVTGNSRAYQTVRACTLSVPVSGVAYIVATATGFLPINESSWVGAFQLAAGATPEALAGDARSERTLFLRDTADLPNDPDSQTSKTLATSLLVPLSAGTYTFGLIGKSEIGTVRLLNPSVSVVFVPSSTADILSCGQVAGAWAATPEQYFQSIVACPLTVPQDGFAFVSATSAVAAATEVYEARFRVGVDVVGVPQSDRYVNVYSSPFLVGSETVASSTIIPVRAGANTFHFLGYRYAGPGQMSVRNASLSVMYFPASSVSLTACSAAGPDGLSIEQATFTPVTSCQLALPRDSFAFIEASTSASIGSSQTGAAQEYEGRSRIAVDGAEGLPETERRFTTEADGGDGSDRTVAEAVVVPLARGAHTLSLNIRRSRGTQPVRLYTPTLTVLVAGPRDYKLLPLISISN